MAQVYSGPSGEGAAPGPRSESTSLGDLTDFFVRHGAGTASSDLALDLLLNEIVTQACQNTGATGAAVAMQRDGVFVCRATTGINAPDLGSELSVTTGLSGICVQAKKTQHCDDASTDPRVDAAACWRLGVQSLMVVPILRGEKVAGVFEVLSPLPKAFGERHEQLLLGLARRITDCLEDRSADKNLPVAGDSRDVSVLLDEAQGNVVPTMFTGPRFSERTVVRDYLTPMLTVLVVGLALLLGWMVGRTGWLHAGKDKATPRAAISDKSEAPEPAPPSTTVPAAAAHAAPPNVTEPSKAKPSQGGLVVYEGGRVVFEMKPAPGAGRGIELAAGRSKNAGSDPVKVSPEVAATYLIERIEPDYPDQARQEHVQGPVVLTALIGRDGAVQKLTALTGDGQLARAAADAVRQWKFKPYAPQGQAVDFETQITVDFALP